MAEIVTTNGVREAITNKNSPVRLAGEVHDFRLPQVLFAKDSTATAHTANFLVFPKKEIPTKLLSKTTTRTLEGILDQITPWTEQLAQRSRDFYSSYQNKESFPDMKVQFPWAKFRQILEGTSVERAIVATWETNDQELKDYALAQYIGSPTSRRDRSSSPKLEREIFVRVFPNKAVAQRVLTYENGVQEGTAKRFIDPLGYRTTDIEILRRGLIAEMLATLRSKGNRALPKYAVPEEVKPGYLPDVTSPLFFDVDTW